MSVIPRRLSQRGEDVRDEGSIMTWEASSEVVVMVREGQRAGEEVFDFSGAAGCSAFIGGGQTRPNTGTTNDLLARQGTTDGSRMNEGRETSCSKTI